MPDLVSARRLAAIGFLFVATVSGCGAQVTAGRAASDTTAAQPVSVDLSRLGEAAEAFPPGYPATRSVVRVGELDVQQAANVGDLVAFGNPLAADPEACRPLLVPVTAHAGTSSARITSADDVMAPFVDVTAYDGVDVAAPIPREGCDRFGFAVRGAISGGAATRLAVPMFEDATTYALRVDFDVTNPESTQEPTVEYFYNAIVGDRAYVSVWARVPADFAAEPVLPDLLARAVTAIRP